MSKTHIESICASLLQELEMIWDEVGETETEREKILIEIEDECRNVYGQKIKKVKEERNRLRQDIVDSETKVIAICSVMEEPSSLGRQLHQSDQSGRSLKEELGKILQKLEDMEKRKSERKNQFIQVIEDIRRVTNEINGEANETCSSEFAVDESDLSLRKLEELHRELYTLQEQKLQDLVTTMLEFWNLMDTPAEEQQKFMNISCNIAATVSEITKPNSLSTDLLEEVKAELRRLEELKRSKMKELILKKRSELEEICRRTHIVLEEEDIAVENVIETIESGDVNPESILEQIEYRAGKVKEEALSRKDILEKTEKWLNACEEENWLEEYNQDENRYNAGKGSHLILKRAEKARGLVNKLPAMVEALVSKITNWESEREAEFLFDGNRLLSMLEEYTELREEKEQERRRKRDLKKLQGQVTSEQEKGTPTKSQNAKKNLKISINKRFTSSPLTPRTDSPHSGKSITPQSRHG